MTFVFRRGGEMAVVKNTLSMCKEIAATREELDFKAAMFHKLWVDREKIRGFHHPDYHADPMKTPPPLRDDGLTRCDECRRIMAPFEKLSPHEQTEARQIVLDAKLCEDAWRNRG